MRLDTQYEKSHHHHHLIITQQLLLRLKTDNELIRRRARQFSNSMSSSQI